MDFNEWYEKNWLPDYHKRFQSIPALESLVELYRKEQERFQKDVLDNKAEIATLKKAMYGNGEKGYVQRVVDEAMTEMSKNLGVVIKDSIREAFEAKEEVQKEADKETRKEWGTRTWALIIIIFQALVGFIVWYLQK